MESTRGTCKPEDARINFAVPSINTIEKFDVSDVGLPKKMPTGIIQPAIESISRSVAIADILQFQHILY